MKKIIFIIILFLSCYLIFAVTKNDKLNYMTMGDGLSKGITPYNANGYGYSNYVLDYLKKDNILNSYNDDFTSGDMRITDLINMINQNVYKENRSINQVIAISDLITLSVGMNELYYKIAINNDGVYNYVDKMLIDMDKLLLLITNLNDKDIYVLGYYNIFDNNQDVFNYANIGLKNLCTKYGVFYIDVQDIFYIKYDYFENLGNFYPNLEGYYKISQKIIEKIENN